MKAPSRIACLSLAACVGLGASGCSTQESSATTRAARPNRYASCNRLALSPPEQMVLVDRMTRNLGDGQMGVIEVFRDGGKQLEAAVGIDVLAAFEDLDFSNVTVSVRGTTGEFSSAGAFGTGDTLTVLHWVEPNTAGVCAKLSLVGTNLDQPTLLAIAESARLNPATG